MEDFSLSFAASELNAAITKANAAAPQSTTYTKTETDTLLSGKVNAETGKGLSTNDFTTTEKNKLSGIEQGATKTVIDTALSGTSTNPVQNKAVQAPVARLMDTGAKNLLKITATSQTVNGVTFTVNDDGTVSVDGTNNTSSLVAFYLNILPADTAPNYNGCRLTGCPSGGSSSKYRLAFQLNSGSYTSYASDIGGGSTVHDVPSADCRVTIIVYAGVTVSNLIFKPMLCTVEDYAISTEFVPYAPSNRELYEGKIDHDIPALTGSILDYAISLPTGIYFARHGYSSGVDKPVTGRRYMYQIMKYTAATITIIAYDGEGASSNSIYMKNYTSSTWGSWIKFTGTAAT